MKKILVLLLLTLLCSGKEYLDLAPDAVIILTNNGSKIVVPLETKANIYSSKDLYYISNSQYNLLKIEQNKEELKKGGYTLRINYEDLYLVDKKNQKKEEKLCILKSPFKEAVKSAKEMLKDINSPIKDLDDNQIISLKIVEDLFLSFSSEGGGYSGGAHPTACLNYFTYNINDKKYVTFGDLCKLDPDLPKKILEKVQLIAKTGDSEILFDANQKQIEEKIKDILLSLGYDYDPEHFYPDVKDGKSGIVFCFPHVTEVNRGTNYKVFVVPKKTPLLFKDYYSQLNQRPKLSKGSEEQIFDTDWTICIDKNMNLIFNNEKYNKKYFIQKLSDENELIGIYYIYDWPVSKDEIFKNYTLVSDSKQ